MSAGHISMDAEPKDVLRDVRLFPRKPRTSPETSCAKMLVETQSGHER